MFHPLPSLAVSKPLFVEPIPLQPLLPHRFLERRVLALAFFRYWTCQSPFMNGSILSNIWNPVLPIVLIVSLLNSILDLLTFDLSSFHPVQPVAAIIFKFRFKMGISPSTAPIQRHCVVPLVFQLCGGRIEKMFLF
jgi:hypothetical protein